MRRKLILIELGSGGVGVVAWGLRFSHRLSLHPALSSENGVSNFKLIKQQLSSYIGIYKIHN